LKHSLCYVLEAQDDELSR
ncbi:hypothetical protein ACUODF_15985, partial [Escherichia coli]